VHLGGELQEAIGRRGRGERAATIEAGPPDLLQDHSGAWALNLRNITLKYTGWCLGVKSAAMFIPDKEIFSRTAQNSNAMNNPTPTPKFTETTETRSRKKSKTRK
jgi:hypothetical protein